MLFMVMTLTTYVRANVIEAWSFVLGYTYSRNFKYLKNYKRPNC